MRRHPLLAACLVACVGCGTTVSLNARGAPASTDLGVGSPGATATGGGDGLSLPGGSGTGATSGSAGATAGVSGSSQPTVPVGTASGPVNRQTVVFHGKRVLPIKVGVTYVKDPAAGLQAIGVQGVTFGDQRAYIKVIVKDINAQGGLAGRPVVPVLFQYNADPGSQPIPEQDASACALFTQDNHIEVAIPNLSGIDLVTCLERHNVPMIEDGSAALFSSATMARNPLLYLLGGINLDRLSTEEVRALVRQNYFAKWDAINGKPGVAPVKVGVVTYDTPDFAEAAQGPMKSGLIAAGYQPEIVAVAYHASYNDLSQAETQIAGDVLKFKAAGITHVIIMDDNGISTLFFLNDAEQQKYRPRYGITSGNNMNLMASGAASTNQLHGSTGIGWWQTGDTNLGKHGQKYSSPGRKACNHMMAKAGETGSGYAEKSALWYCAPFAVLQLRWPLLSAESSSEWQRVMNALGSSYSNPLVPATFIDAAHHDGLGGVYDYFYDDGCGCMAYSANVQLLSH